MMLPNSSMSPNERFNTNKLSQQKAGLSSHLAEPSVAQAPSARVALEEALESVQEQAEEEYWPMA